MNNQQAINLLKGLEKNLDDYCELNDEGKTAFGMAISALNCSEIPNNSNTISRQLLGANLAEVGTDCISRQAAIEAIHEDADWLVAQGSDWQVERMERDKSILMSLPSVQPEHMHTVMLKIAEKYEKAMNTSCILNPMAWALYQTWKEYDR